MGLLELIFHATMMIFGAYVPLNTVKYPKILMLINRVALIGLLIYLMI